MSPTLNGSSTIRRFKRSDVIEIRDGITFDFYMGLPHMLLHSQDTNLINIGWLQVSVSHDSCPSRVKINITRMKQDKDNARTYARYNTLWDVSSPVERITLLEIGPDWRETISIKLASHCLIIRKDA